MSLLRRRIMMQEHQDSDKWDIEWDYTMGMPEDNGLKVTLEQNPVYKMTDSGLYLKVTSSSGYVRLLSPVETCNKGNVEAVIQFDEFASSNGFRLLLSNGVYGCQAYVASSRLLYNKGASVLNPGTGQYMRNLTANVDYTLRLEFDENTGNKIYLDGNLIGEFADFSEYYCTGNRLFQQTDGSTYLKSLKFKFG